MPQAVEDLQALFDKINVKITTAEGTKEVNIFSDPVLLAKFMKYCTDSFVSENISFLYELYELWQQKVQTGLEPDPRILEELYDKYIKPDTGTEINISSTLREATYEKLYSLESIVKGTLASFYEAAQEASTLLNTNELLRFKKAEEDAQHEQANRDKKIAQITAEIAETTAKKQSLVYNRSGEDVTTVEYTQKIEEIDNTLSILTDTKLALLKKERVRINDAFASFEKEQKQKTVQPTNFLKIGSEMLALDTIKRIDADLEKNERAILEHFNNKGMFNIDTFEENQKKQAEYLEKIESTLFNALLDERKQLFEQQSAILKSSIENPISLETKKKLEAIKGNLEANRAYIEKRFNKVDGKNSNADVKKMDVFRDTLAQEEQERFNALITKQNLLFSARMFEKDATKINSIDKKLADNEAAIEMMLDTAKKNSDPSAQQAFKEKSHIFEELTAMQQKELSAALTKTIAESQNLQSPSQPERKRKNLKETLKGEDPFRTLLAQREALFTRGLEEKDPKIIFQIKGQLEANRQTIEMIIGNNKEEADIFKQAQQKESKMLATAKKASTKKRPSITSLYRSQKEKIRTLKGHFRRPSSSDDTPPESPRHRSPGSKGG